MRSMNLREKSPGEYVPRRLPDRLLRSIGSIGSLFLLLSFSAGFAAAPANFEQEWAKLSAAAKQEATLSIASGGAPSRQYRPVVDVFSKKFGVKVEVSTGNATDTALLLGPH